MAGPAAGERADASPVVERAREFDREALGTLVDRCLDRVYTTSFALTGTHARAERLTGDALVRTVAGIGDFEGDEDDFEATATAAAVAGAARERAGALGLREGLGQLSAAEYTIIGVRVVAGIETERAARALGLEPAAARAHLLKALRALAPGEPGARVSWGADLTGFDRAVDRVGRGASPAVEAARVGEPADVLARLGSVSTFRRLARPEPAAAVAARIRGVALAEAAEGRVAWVRTNRGGATIAGPIRGPGRLRRVAAVLAVPVLVGLAIAVGLLVAGAAALADPDSPLYGVKRAGEAALLSINPDPISRADLEVNLAQTRTLEAEDMAAQGKGELAVAALQERDQEIQSAGTDLEATGVRTARWNSVRDHLLRVATTPLAGVQRDLQARGQVESAAELAQMEAAWPQTLTGLHDRLGGAPLPPAPLAAA